MPLSSTSKLAVWFANVDIPGDGAAQLHLCRRFCELYPFMFESFGRRLDLLELQC